MPLTPEQKRQAEALRVTKPDWGDRRIAKAVGATYAEVRWDREHSPEASLLHPPEDGPAILIFDIETAPALVWVWRQYDTNVVATEQDWYVLSFAYKWLGQDEGGFVSIIDSPTFEPDTSDDRYVVERLAWLLDQADVVVAHNGDRFDLKRLQARMLYHDIDPPSPYKSIDTLKESKRYFGHYAHSLNELARLLGLGQKVPHHGFDLWRDAMRGNESAWQVMEAYNRHDVDLLEALYKRLLAWTGSPGKPSAVNHNQWAEDGEVVCAKCGRADTLIKRGFHRTKVSVFQTYQCSRAQGGCGGYVRARTREKTKGVEVL